MIKKSSIKHILYKNITDNNNNYQANIHTTPYEALHGQRCQY
jgi:hypothetical protein